MLAGGADLELGCQEEGRGADATPDLQFSKLSCPRQDCPEATVTGLLKPERSPRVPARRQDQGGNWRPSYLFLSHLSRPRTATPAESETRRQHARVRQRPGGAMLYASRLHALRHRSAKPEGGPQPLAAGRTPAGSATRMRRGHGPSGGVPSDASLTPRLGDRPTLSSDQGGQRPGDVPGLSPSGGPGCPAAALVSGDWAGSVRPPEGSEAQVPGLGPGERSQGPVCQDDLTPCPLARHSRTKGACSTEVPRLSCHPRRHTHGQLGQWGRRPAAPQAEPGPWWHLARS